MTDSYHPLRLVEAQSRALRHHFAYFPNRCGLPFVKSWLAYSKNTALRGSDRDRVYLVGEARIFTVRAVLVWRWPGPGSGRKKTVTRLAKQGVRSLESAAWYSPVSCSNDQPPGSTLPSKLHQPVGVMAAHCLSIETLAAYAPTGSRVGSRPGKCAHWFSPRQH